MLSYNNFPSHTKIRVAREKALVANACGKGNKSSSSCESVTYVILFHFASASDHLLSILTFTVTRTRSYEG